jgi:hypothetical protein
MSRRALGIVVSFLSIFAAAHAAVAAAPAATAVPERGPMTGGNTSASVPPPPDQVTQYVRALSVRMALSGPLSLQSDILCPTRWWGSSVSKLDLRERCR